MTLGQFETIGSGIYLEGLAVDHDRDVIWYSDVVGGGIHGVKPDGTQVGVLNPERMWTGGVLMNGDGAVLSSGQHGVMWNDPDSGRSGWLLNEIDGQPIVGINEMMPDGTGGIFFGTVDLDKIIHGQETRPTNLYRLSVDGTVTTLVEGLRFTNGLMFDADRRKFYCSSTFDRVWQWDVTDDLTLTNQRELMAKDDPDGMALDCDGNIWVTGVGSSLLYRATPDGTAMDAVETPMGPVTQIRFGGADGKDVYLNVVPADGGETLKEGGELTGNQSFLLRGRSDVAGMKVGPSGFDIL